MATSQSRTVLDWFRSYASTKFAALGLATDSSNMNVPLNNDNRVQAAVTYLDAREAELIAAWTPALEPFWQAALDELWSDINTQMPANIRTAFADLWADADPNVLHLLKTLIRVLARAIQTVRGGG